MLVDLENFKAEQVGRQSVLRQMDEIQGSAREVLNSLRELLYELRNERGVEEGFVEALDKLVARFQERSRISASLAVLPGWPARLKSAAAVNIYRIIEEALANVRQHSGAGLVRVSLEPHGETQFAVFVSDDGRGRDLDMPGLMGMGTVGMKERALFLGGQLKVDSVVGGGTVIRLIVPKESMA
jgi:two-component system sensor histidine kinase DegS